MPHGLGCGKRSALRPRPPKRPRRRKQAAAGGCAHQPPPPQRATARAASRWDYPLRNAQRARAAGGARRALRRACSGKWAVISINPRFLARFGTSFLTTFLASFFCQIFDQGFGTRKCSVQFDRDEVNQQKQRK